MSITLQSSPMRLATSGALARSTGRQVICICGGYGYPRGSGSPARITVVGKALQQAGLDFRLLHCGPSPNPDNTERSGVYEGIAFEYMTAPQPPTNKLEKTLVYLRAMAGVTARLVRLRRERRRTAVWLYIIEGPVNLYVSTVCRLLGLPVVQELCEWWPGEGNHCTRFTRWMHRWPMFVNPAGVLVISRLIEDRVRQSAARVNPFVRIHRLPAIVDAERFVSSGFAATPTDSSAEAGWFLWCGAHPWAKDVKFIVRAMAVARRQGVRCRLKVVGGWVENAQRQVLSVAAAEGVPAEDIRFTGYVNDRELEESYRRAAALLLPLPDDDRSRTRMPNKLGEYLASGRPVITSAVGDMSGYVTGGVNALLAKPDDPEDFARQMIDALRNPERAARIGAEGRQMAREHLDYRAHANSLAAWFMECIEHGR